MPQDWFDQFEDVTPEEADWFAQFADAPPPSIAPPPDRIGVAASKATGISADDRGPVARTLDRFSLAESPILGTLAGAVKEGINVVGQTGDLARAGWNLVAPEALAVERPYQDPTVQRGLAPANPYQQLGQRGVQGAELYSGARALAQAPGIVARGLGISKARAGANIESAIQKAGTIGIKTEAPAAAGVRARELQATGSRPVRAIRQFMQRIEAPDAPDVTVKEAQDFASSLSRLSVNEFNNLNPQMQRQVVVMRDALRQAITEAADTVGAGGQYASGVREYARAGAAAKYAKRGAKLVGGGLTAQYLVNQIKNALKESLKEPGR